jgi:hypothetical protein
MAIHKGIDDIRRQEGLPSRRSTLNQSHSPHEEVGGYGYESGNYRYANKRNSDLPPLKLSIDEHEDEQEVKSVKKKESTASFWDLEALKREKGVDGWVEHDDGDDYGLAPDEIPSSVGRSGGRGTGTGSGSGRGKGRKFDSPIEMIDRTRPW